MRNLLLVIIAGVSLTGVMSATEKAINLSGTWVLDPARSESKHTHPGMRIITANTNIGGISSGSGDDPDGRDPDDGNGPLDASPGGLMENLTLLIVQTDAELQVTRKLTINGEERTVPQRFALDGSQCLNLASNGQGEFASRTSWQNNKLINSGTETTTIRGQRTEISAKEEYSISKNGNKLTIKTISASARGVTTLKQVFVKPGKVKF